MKQLFFLFGVLLTGLAGRAQPAALMPAVQSASFESGHFLLNNHFRISVWAGRGDSIIYRAASRFEHSLADLTGLYFRQTWIQPGDTVQGSEMVVRVQRAAEMALGVEESYHLEVNASGILLSAETTMGALHGLETVLQLLTYGADGAFFPFCRIDDRPAMMWRGLMIDVSRHFMPIDVLERNIDAMAHVKMNVLHLHLSDDQGFRVESKVFPLLTARGSLGEFYSQAQIRELLQYARFRGIMIVPEFDMPGHASSWFAGYPELASQPGPYEPGQPMKRKESDSGALTLQKAMVLMQTIPFPSFDPSKEKTYQFLDKFFGEMTGLFPGAFFHIGADENNGVAWKQNPSIVAFMKEKNLQSTHELQAYFVSRVVTILKKYHRQVVGWEELFGKNLPKEVTVQLWNPMTGGDLAQKIVQAGNPMLVSKGLYLDYFMPAHIHYQTAFPKGLLGVEAAIWAELCNAQNLETRVWPRAAAVAERGWSAEQEGDLHGFYLRLFRTSARLDALGLQHLSNYDRMVRRFSCGENPEAVQVLFSTLSPVKGVKRLFGLNSKPPAAALQTASMSGAADIVQVDSRDKWLFHIEAEKYLSSGDTASARYLRSRLQQWKDNDARLQSLFAVSSLAREVQPHSQRLSLLAAAALEAMGNIKMSDTEKDAWRQSKKDLISNAKGSEGEVELNVLQELEGLILGKMAATPKQYPIF